MACDDVDNNRVDLMKKVDSATELGAFVGFRSGPWAASLTYATDVSDERDGAVTELAGPYHLSANDDFSLKCGANVSHADVEYMDTYPAGNIGKETPVPWITDKHSVVRLVLQTK